MRETIMISKHKTEQYNLVTNRSTQLLKVHVHVYIANMYICDWIKDHFCQNICDMIYDKGSLLKCLLNSFVYTYAVTMNSCVYIATVCIQNCFWDVLTVVLFHKSHQKCIARSDTLLQIRSHIHPITLSDCTLT